jgi:hypothetical protein
MFYARLLAAVHVPGVDYRVVSKMDKGYADSANLSAPPDFDCAKFKQSVRGLAFAAIVTQPTVSRHGKARQTEVWSSRAVIARSCKGGTDAPGRDGRGRQGSILDLVRLAVPFLECGPALRAQ